MELDIMISIFIENSSEYCVGKGNTMLSSDMCCRGICFLLVRKNNVNMEVSHSGTISSISASLFQIMRTFHPKLCMRIAVSVVLEVIT